MTFDKYKEMGLSDDSSQNLAELDRQIDEVKERMEADRAEWIAEDPEGYKSTHPSEQVDL